MSGADVLSSNPSRDRIFLLPGLNASRVARVEITNIETKSRINVRKCLKELEAIVFLLESEAVHNSY